MDLNEYFTEKASVQELFTTGCFLTDGIIIALNSPFYIENILNNFKNNLREKSILQLRENIGNGKGEPFTVDKLIFLDNNLAKPIIDYNKKYCFDYKLLQMILKTYGTYRLSFFVSKNKEEEPTLKIYRDKELLAVFMAMQK